MENCSFRETVSGGTSMHPVRRSKRWLFHILSECGRCLLCSRYPCSKTPSHFKKVLCGVPNNAHTAQAPRSYISEVLYCTVLYCPSQGCSLVLLWLVLACFSERAPISEETLAVAHCAVLVKPAEQVLLHAWGAPLSACLHPREPSVLSVLKSRSTKLDSPDFHHHVWCSASSSTRPRPPCRLHDCGNRMRSPSPSGYSSALLLVGDLSPRCQV